MRTRLIRAGFFENETLAALPAHARLLFIALWLMADRAGRLKDRPAVIRATAFPFEDVNVEALLEQLACAGFIVRYVAPVEKAVENSIESCIAIVQFSTHQNPHPREPASKLPPPPKTSKKLSKNAKPWKSRSDTDLDTDLDTKKKDTDAGVTPASRQAAYVALATQALQRTLIDDHTDNILRVTERFRDLCRQRGVQCDAESGAQAIEAALRARDKKSHELLELMRVRAEVEEARARKPDHVALGQAWQGKARRGAAR
jgi:hypothetical protein